MNKEDITKTNITVDFTAPQKRRKKLILIHGNFTINLQLWIKMTPDEQLEYIKTQTRKKEIIDYNVIS